MFSGSHCPSISRETSLGDGDQADDRSLRWFESLILPSIRHQSDSNAL